MKKAAIYCRLSEEDKNKLCATDDSGSIQNQKAMLMQYAEEQGWEVYQIYSDDDYTGADRRRPQFNRLLKDNTSSILSSAKHSPALPANWSW
jgi:site-specific DNA recombinase